MLIFQLINTHFFSDPLNVVLKHQEVTMTCDGGRIYYSLVINFSLNLIIWIAIYSKDYCSWCFNCCIMKVFCYKQTEGHKLDEQEKPENKILQSCVTRQNNR